MIGSRKPGYLQVIHNLSSGLYRKNGNDWRLACLLLRFYNSNGSDGDCRYVKMD